jgi:DNA binding domain, excisionase family
MTPTPNLDDDALLTLDDVAKRLRVSRRHLSKLMAQGSGPATVDLGRRRLVRRAAFQEWVAARERAA